MLNWYLVLPLIYFTCLKINQEEKENIQRQKTEKEMKLAVTKVTTAYEEKLATMKAEQELAIQQCKHYHIFMTFCLYPFVLPLLNSKKFSI